MFEKLRRWLRKSEVMAECKQAAAGLNVSDGDLTFQNSVCNCMEQNGYKYDGDGSMTDGKFYSS